MHCYIKLIPDFNEANTEQMFSKAENWQATLQTQKRTTETWQNDLAAGRLHADSGLSDEALAISLSNAMECLNEGALIRPTVSRSISDRNVFIQNQGMKVQTATATNAPNSEAVSIPPSRSSFKSQNVKPNRNVKHLNLNKVTGFLGPRSEADFMNSVGLQSPISQIPMRSSNLANKRLSFHSPRPMMNQRLSDFVSKGSFFSKNVRHSPFSSSRRIGFEGINVRPANQNGTGFPAFRDHNESSKISPVSSFRNTQFFEHPILNDPTQNSNAFKGLPTFNSDRNMKRFSSLRVTPEVTSTCKISCTITYNQEKSKSTRTVARVYLESESADEDQSIAKRASKFRMFQIPDYFMAFTYSSIALFNNIKICFNSTIPLRLLNLRKLCGALFLFESTSRSKLERLSDLERGVFLKIIEKKQYHNKAVLKNCLMRTAEPDVMHFRRMTQVRRREMLIKYTFRAVTKLLKHEFETKILSQYTSVDRTTKQDKTTLFYLYYFGHKLYTKKFEQLIFDFYSDKDFKNNAEDDVKRFYFPDMKNQRRAKKSRNNGPPSFKSFNRIFFQSIAKCPVLFGKINHAILKTLPHLIDCGQSLENSVLRNQKLCGDDLALNVLYFMIDNNNREISKVFTEWYNLCDTKSDAEILDHKVLERIYKNIDKSNFKFPWSVAEAKKAFLETLFIINEGVHFVRSKGKSYFLRQI